MSGTGKSTALRELRRRGFETVDTDEPGWSVWSDEDGGYVWREDRIDELLARERSVPLYVSGTVSNQGRFYGRFDAVVLLSAPADVLLGRVASRTGNPYGKGDAERGEILRNLAEVEPLLRATCTHELDATQPVERIVEALVALTSSIAVVREVRQGVWHWEARHPDWTPQAGGWGPEVSSYAIDDGERLLLFDPLAVPDEVVELASQRETAIVVSCPWHRRDAVALSERLGVPIYVPAPDEGDEDPVPGEVYMAGDSLPVGVDAYPGMEPNDLVLWVESHRALVVGDSLIDRGDGLEFPRDWAMSGAIAARGVSPEDILQGLRTVLELPVELVLPTHGEPTDRAALERALSG